MSEKWDSGWAVQVSWASRIDEESRIMSMAFGCVRTIYVRYPPPFLPTHHELPG